ncbi:GNAT family N-acetyltransferase [Paenibacillus glycanilyticus]|uniref:GNAT family N-acetyltransferase n=1 Tax=Paenibacillus glycanilyticus TaxID=126569 RepID=UPI002559806A|nr:GNAT family N-acetyltransferase [Paenibacillus glycanilyticus]
MILFRGKEIGLRTLEPEDAEKGTLYGMDQFIGEPGYWNKGIGSELMKETVRYLTMERGAVKIAMDPQAWNARALRVYEKNGFKKVKLLEKHEWHEGEYRDCWLMVYEAGKA